MGFGSDGWYAYLNAASMLGGGPEAFQGSRSVNFIYTDTAGCDAPRRGVTGESEIGSTSDALYFYAIGVDDAPAFVSMASIPSVSCLNAN